MRTQCVVRCRRLGVSFWDMARCLAPDVAGGASSYEVRSAGVSSASERIVMSAAAIASASGG